MLLIKLFPNITKKISYLRISDDSFSAIFILVDDLIYLKNRINTADYNLMRKTIKISP